MSDSKVPKSRRRRRRRPAGPQWRPPRSRSTIVELEEEMLVAAEDLRFEYAAKLRDEIRDLKRELGSGGRRSGRSDFLTGWLDRLANPRDSLANPPAGSGTLQPAQTDCFESRRYSRGAGQAEHREERFPCRAPRVMTPRRSMPICPRSPMRSPTSSGRRGGGATPWPRRPRIRFAPSSRPPSHSACRHPARCREPMPGRSATRPTTRLRPLREQATEQAREYVGKVSESTRHDAQAPGRDGE